MEGHEETHEKDVKKETTDIFIRMLSAAPAPLMNALPPSITYSLVVSSSIALVIRLAASEPEPDSK